MTERPDLRALSFEALAGKLAELGEPSYRAAQLYSWLHPSQGGGAISFSEMTNLSKQLRRTLEENFTLTVLSPVETLISRDGTRKYLFGLADGNVIETVYMRYRFGVSICVSSQVGCRRGCSFCASTIGGCVRDLTAGEMLEEIAAVERDTGERAAHVVVMGSGEPFDNYEQVMCFLRLLTDGRGRALGARHITVSTCGVVPGIERFADEGMQVGLAISLHAPEQELRKRLMPVAGDYDLDMLMTACEKYYAKTGRQLTFEYALIAGVNDNAAETERLAELLSSRQFDCMVNLIPVNPVRERGYAPGNRTSVREFQKRLEKHGIHATIRRELGGDIDGACGQLRRRYTDQINREVGVC
ncbi:MAG: 23S rRNA (adenine(2503)-C(2))-methyltransferase RlmN [Butyrivibrio sp.]|nr:23S rRNA (adenine(2503)-C(2))-methyltransferase RlmN [Butyrivibrio sp.]